MLSEDQKPPCKCPFSGGWEFLATIPTLYMAQNLAFGNSVMKGNFGGEFESQNKKDKTLIERISSSLKRGITVPVVTF